MVAITTMVFPDKSSCPEDRKYRYAVSMSFLRSIRIKDEIDVPDQFPFNLPVIRGKGFSLEFPSSVTFFVGENGSGKSTVLEAIAMACGFNPAGGSQNNVYDFQSTESSLASALRLSWSKKMNRGFFLRAESFFNFATYLEQAKKEQPGFDWFGPYGGESLHEMSHGESFLALLKNRFRNGIFLLDEPEAALSPTRQLGFLALLHSMVQDGESQFIIATHSPILLAYPHATIYLFDENGIRPTIYKETEHYRVTKDFLDAPEVFLRHLIKE